MSVCPTSLLTVFDHTIVYNLNTEHVLRMDIQTLCVTKHNRNLKRTHSQIANHIQSYVAVGVQQFASQICELFLTMLHTEPIISYSVMFD